MQSPAWSALGITGRDAHRQIGLLPLRQLLDPRLRPAMQQQNSPRRNLTTPVVAAALRRIGLRVLIEPAERIENHNDVVTAR